MSREAQKEGERGVEREEKCGKGLKGSTRVPGRKFSSLYPGCEGVGT